MTLAHHPVSPATIWIAWTLDPSAIVLVVLGVLYGLGVRRLRDRNRAWSAWRSSAFYAGIATLALALLSPLHALGEALFSAHMVQHLLLILVAAPLLVLGAPMRPLLASAPTSLRRAYAAVHRLTPWRALRRASWNVIVVWGLHALAMWSWHLPTLYQAGLESPVWHAAEHTSFLVTGVLFWRLAVPAGRRRRPHATGASIALVFGTGLQSAVLGAVLAFASRPLYAYHLHGTRAWDVDALTDQRLAGLIMWVPAGAVYLATMAIVFLTWMRRLDAGTHSGAIPTSEGS